MQYIRICIITAVFILLGLCFNNILERFVIKLTRYYTRIVHIFAKKVKRTSGKPVDNSTFQFMLNQRLLVFVVIRGSPRGYDPSYTTLLP